MDAVSERRSKESNDVAPAAAEVTLVIPVYNEEHTIMPLVQEIKRCVRPGWCALIIYDHEDDSTLKKLDEITAQHDNVRFVWNRVGAGVVNAFRTGFAEADTPYVVPIMADLSDMPETVNAMHERIRDGYDLVVASRYAPGGAKTGGPLLKYALSRIANATLHALTRIPTHDMTNAFVMYRRPVLDSITIESTGGFEITMEIIAKAFVRGYRITEVPTVNRDRAAGKSKFKLMHWILKYLYWFLYILACSVRRRLHGSAEAPGAPRPTSSTGSKPEIGNSGGRA
jgi:glycosyltransferase involved in cell wall biosynthesis